MKKFFPSGSIIPSQEDKNIINKIRAAGDIMNIKLLDHMIIAGKSYLSFKESGLL
jgi:DNA repair protein RadC